MAVSKPKLVPIRYTIVALALLINVVSYVDRACISVAAPSLRAEYGFTPGQMGMIFSVFSLAYFLFLTPWGMIADRFGARGTVTLAIVWWSSFTALTAAAWNFVWLMVIRFLFGGVEAAISPSVASSFTRWIPLSERSTAFGAFLSGGRIGAAFTPALAAVILLRYGWRAMFLSFACLGVLAGAAWWFWYRNWPSEHPCMSREELDAIAAIETPRGPRERPRWRKLLSSRPLILILLVAFTYTFMWQFYITWFPTYLLERHGFTLRQASRYAGLPFVIGLGASWAGGLLTDLLAKRFGVRLARCSVGFVSLLVAALFLGCGIFCSDRHSAAILIALGGGFGDLHLGATWAATVDIGGKAAGAVSGLMNSASNFGGFVSPMMLGWVLGKWNNWDAVLSVAAASGALSAFLWLGVFTERNRKAEAPG